MHGSGWVFLIDRKGTLEVVTTLNSNTPSATDASITNILCLDVWEHSFWTDFSLKREVLTTLGKKKNLFQDSNN